LSFPTSENNVHWERFLSNLIARGLGGKLLEVIVYDGEQAIIQASNLCFPLAKQQRCVFHKLKNVTSAIKHTANRKRCSADASFVYQVQDKASAYKRMRWFEGKWRYQEPLACKRFLNDFDETLTFLEFDQKLRKRIRTTNYLDRYLERTKKKNTSYEFLYRPSKL